MTHLGTWYSDGESFRACSFLPSLAAGKSFDRDDKVVKQRTSVSWGRKSGGCHNFVVSTGAKRSGETCGPSRGPDFHFADVDAVHNELINC